MTRTTGHIPIEATTTLAGVFRERVARTPATTAYVQFERDTQSWVEYSWLDMQQHVARWQQGLTTLDLERGDRVAMMLRNCVEWVVFDQAALGMGLVTVPVYTNDRAGNIGYILKDAGARVLLIEGEEQWRELQGISDTLETLDAVITLRPVDAKASGVTLVHAPGWLPAAGEADYRCVDADPASLATIVYTSGTTGRPKGVMLSHRNILWNIAAVLTVISVHPDDRLLSFLPLSHTFERTTGYYLTVVTASTVTFSRSIEDLAEDLLLVRPTILISVPRIFERVHARIRSRLDEESSLKRKLFALAVDCGWERFEHAQGRSGWRSRLLLWPFLEKLVASKIQARLGGRLRFAVAGGAPLSPDISRFFIGLGIPIVQGYGLTETSPVITANRLEDNQPATVGRPLPGIEIRIGPDSELLTRSRSVMLGYWNNEQATRETIDPEGWLHTGDQVKLDDHGRVTITGRLKEVIVLANGEKVPPSDMEMAIALDPLVEQVMIIGEGRPYLAALLVLNPERLDQEGRQLGIDLRQPHALHDKRLIDELLRRIGERMETFPGYAQLRRVAVIDEPWNIENDMMTPTMKLKRARILERYQLQVEELYAGH